MSGTPGHGGSNRLSLEAHRLRGTYKPSRHEGRTDPEPAAVSPAARRRTVDGLGPEAHRLVGALLRSYSGWDAATLTTLRSFALSCDRLRQLEQAHTPASDSRELYREIRANVMLLKMLNLEVAR
jgi:hypothetical protein